MMDARPSMHGSQSARTLLLCMLVVASPLGASADPALTDERPLPYSLEVELFPRGGARGNVTFLLDHMIHTGSVDNFHLAVWLEPKWGEAYHPWKAYIWPGSDVYRAGFFVDIPDAAAPMDAELLPREYWETHGGSYILTLRNLSIPMRVVIGAVAGMENTGRLTTTIEADPTILVNRTASGNDTHAWSFHRSAAAEARAGVRVIGGGARVVGHDEHVTTGRTYISAEAFGSLCRRTGPDALWDADWADCTANPATTLWSGAPGRYAIDVIAEPHAELAPTNLVTADNGLRDSTAMLMIVDIGRP